MNEKRLGVGAFLLGLVLGAILSGGTIYYFSQRASTRAVESLRATNTRLELELGTSRDFVEKCRVIVGSAESTVSKLRAIIEAMPDN